MFKTEATLDQMKTHYAGRIAILKIHVEIMRKRGGAVAHGHADIAEEQKNKLEQKLFELNML